MILGCTSIFGNTTSPPPPKKKTRWVRFLRSAVLIERQGDLASFDGSFGIRREIPVGGVLPLIGQIGQIGWVFCGTLVVLALFWVVVSKIVFIFTPKIGEMIQFD